MAHPRCILPNGVYLITRRAYQRTFRLRPHPLTNQVTAYCAAWAAAKSGVRLHAYVVMSNHHHLVVTDPRGVLPDFLRELHRTITKALNALHGERENLWAAEPASVVLLPTLRDVLTKIAYCAANPVAAALVMAPESWPGVNYWRPGARVVVRRPAVYFDPRGDMPATVELCIVPPSGVDAVDWSTQVVRAVTEKVSEARASVIAQGRRFLGARAVQETPVLAKASSSEDAGGHRPSLASQDAGVRRLYRSAQTAFRAAYGRALELWQRGCRHTVFPPGTWWMRVHHRVAVAPAPS